MGSKKLPFEISRHDIAQQRIEVINSAGYHGLNERNTRIIGGAGLALHGLVTTVPMLAEKMPKNGNKPFDIDAVSVPGSDKWPKGMLRRGSLHIDGETEGALPLTLIRGNDARVFAYCRLGYSSLEAMIADYSKIDGLGVQSLYGIVRGKILGNGIAGGADRVKDRVGILGAHMIARVYENPVADDPCWLSAVGVVMNRLNPNRENSPIIGINPMLPAWVNVLCLSNFDHPAFDNVRDVQANVARVG